MVAAAHQLPGWHCPGRLTSAYRLLPHTQTTGNPKATTCMRIITCFKGLLIMTRHALHMHSTYCMCQACRREHSELLIIPAVQSLAHRVNADIHAHAHTQVMVAVLPLLSVPCFVPSLLTPGRGGPHVASL